MNHCAYHRCSHFGHKDYVKADYYCPLNTNEKCEIIIMKPKINDNSRVNHPSHYGGEKNAYEAIKVIEAWNLGFHLGNTVKYISRCGKKAGSSLLEDLEKAKWYIERAIQFEKEAHHGKDDENKE